MTTKTAKRKIEVRHNTPRGVEGVKCKCGGWADSVEPTKAEIEKYNCGRPYNCCAVAFKCCICKTRIVGKQAAPDMD